MLIGITGTDGGGKGAVVDYLVSEKGFAHYSGSGLITEAIEKRGMQVNRDNLRLVGNDLRRQFGNDYIARELIERSKNDNAKNVIIESVREVSAADLIKSSGGTLLAVDADQKIRYERITKRGSKKDSVSFDKFCEQEATEMNDPDPHGMQKRQVIEAADYTIQNNGTLEELHKEIDKFLAEYTPAQ